MDVKTAANFNEREVDNLRKTMFQAASFTKYHDSQLFTSKTVGEISICSWFKRC